MAIYSISTRTLTRNGKTKAMNHYMYITRQGRFSNIKDIKYYDEGNLPKCDELKEMKDYWQAADENGRKNARTCRQLTIALQEEFSLEQNIELVENLLDHFGIRENQTYSFAIHSKPASYDPKHQNIHAHVMFNERILNPSRQFQKAREIFERYRGPKLQDEKGGLKIDRYFHDKQFVKDMRKYWADINNQKFKELGIDKKISEKTLKAQKEELEAEGRYEEAETLDRAPGKHYGPKAKDTDIQKDVQKIVRDEEEKIDALMDQAKKNIIDSLEKEGIEYPEAETPEVNSQEENSLTRTLTMDEMENYISESEQEIEEPKQEETPQNKESPFNPDEIFNELEEENERANSDFYDDTSEIENEIQQHQQEYMQENQPQNITPKTETQQKNRSKNEPANNENQIPYPEIPAPEYEEAPYNTDEDFDFSTPDFDFQEEENQKNTPNNLENEEEKIWNNSQPETQNKEEKLVKNQVQNQNSMEEIPLPEEEIEQENNFPTNENVPFQEDIPPIYENEYTDSNNKMPPTYEENFPESELPNNEEFDFSTSEIDFQNDSTFQKEAAESERTTAEMWGSKNTPTESMEEILASIEKKNEERKSNSSAKSITNTREFSPENEQIPDEEIPQYDENIPFNEEQQPIPEDEFSSQYETNPNEEIPSYDENIPFEEEPEIISQNELPPENEMPPQPDDESYIYANDEEMYANNNTDSSEDFGPEDFNSQDDIPDIEEIESISDINNGDIPEEDIDDLIPSEEEIIKADKENEKREAAQKSNKKEIGNILSVDQMKRELQHPVITKETFNLLVQKEYARLLKEKAAQISEDLSKLPKIEEIEKKLQEKDLSTNEKEKLLLKAKFEIKKRMFAKNILIKKIAQKQQFAKAQLNATRYKRTMHILKKYGLDEKVMTNGIILTVKDVSQEMGHLIKEREEAIKKINTDIKTRSQTLKLSKQEIKDIAREKITQNKDQKLEEEITRIKERIKEVQKVTNKIIKDPKDYVEKYEEEKALKAKLKEKEKNLEDWRIKYDTTLKKEIIQYQKDIENQNAKIIQQNKKDRETIENLKKEITLLTDRKTELEKNFPKETILYGENIPKKVWLTCTIEGKQLKRMPFIIVKDQPYTIINKPKNIEYGKPTKVECVKLGETTDNGKAKIYEAEVIVTQEKIRNSKTLIPKYTPIKIQPTNKKVPLYPLTNQKVIEKYRQQKLSKTTQQKVAPINSAQYTRASNFLNKMIDDTLKTPKLGKITKDEKSEDRKVMETSSNELERRIAAENEALENGEWAKSMRIEYSNIRH